MKQEKILVIDIGSSKVVALTATLRENNGADIENIGIVESDVFLGSDIRDMQKATEVLERAVRKAVVDKSLSSRHVFVGISSPRIGYRHADGHTNIDNRKISKTDIERAISDALHSHVSEDSYVIYAYPNTYHVDNSGHILNPINMPAKRLEVETLLIYAQKGDIQRFDAVLSEVGIKNAKYVYKPLGTSFAVLDENERKEGTLLLDIGYVTTDIAVWKDHSIQYMGTIFRGGGHITNDLSKVFKIPIKKAENVKLRINDINVMEDENGEIRLELGSEGLEKVLDYGEVIETIQARLIDILNQIKTTLLRNKVYELINSRIIVVGGSSKLKGLTKFMQNYFELPVYIGKVRGYQARSPIVKDQALASVAGIISIARKSLDLEVNSKRHSNNFFQKVKRVLDGLI